MSLELNTGYKNCDGCPYCVYKKYKKLGSKMPLSTAWMILIPLTGLVSFRCLSTNSMHFSSMNSQADRISPSMALQVVNVSRTLAKLWHPSNRTQKNQEQKPGPQNLVKWFKKSIRLQVNQGHLCWGSLRSSCACPYKLLSQSMSCRNDFPALPCHYGLTWWPLDWTDCLLSPHLPCSPHLVTVRAGPH